MARIFEYLFETTYRYMKKLSLALVAGLLLSLSSCQVIGDIFKAGVWSGIILVVVIIALVIFVIGKIFGGGRS